MSLTRMENEKLIDVFNGKEIKDLYGPNPKPEDTDTHPGEEKNSVIKQIFERKLTCGDFWRTGFFN